MQVSVPGGRNCRLQQGGLTLLDETYNASPEAVLAALELLAAQPGRRFAVLGTMLELGERSLELHQEVAARAVQLGLDGLVLVDGGEEGKAMAEVAAPLPHLQLVSHPEDAAAPLAAWLNSGDVLLLKALSSRTSPEFSQACLLYTSPSPRDLSTSRMPSSA